MLVRTVLLVALALSPLAALAQEDDGIDPRFGRRTARAVPSLSFEKGDPINRKDFDFGRNIGKAWLAERGELKIETWIEHRGLLCATYEVGIRFGRGEPACTDVDWLAPIHWLTSRRQCNSAIVQHTGVDTDEHMVAVFDQVTCAERVVRCTGNCK
jgi:hypothetical protein